MSPPTEITYEACGQTATVAQNEHTDSLGKPITWPIVATKPDGIYAEIACPRCGEREQKIADRPSAPR